MRTPSVSCTWSIWLATRSKRPAVVGQRQQVVEEHAVMASTRPDARRTSPAGSGRAASSGAADDRGRAALRRRSTGPTPCTRQRKVAGDVGQQPVRRTAGAHVVLGVNLEEIERARIVEDRRARARPSGRRRRWRRGSFVLSAIGFARHVSLPIVAKVLRTGGAPPAPRCQSDFRPDA